VCVEAVELKRARCGRLWTQNTEEEEEEEEVEEEGGGGAFGFLLTAEELNRCSFGRLGFRCHRRRCETTFYICGYF
jgi:hypothetical protein